MPRQPPDLTLIRIGEALADARNTSTLTQREAAARIGVGPHTIASWEAGRRCPPLAALIDIAEAYGVKPWELARQIFDAISRRH